MLRDIVFQDTIYEHYLASSSGNRILKLPGKKVTFMFDRTQVSSVDMDEIVKIHRETILRDGYCPDKRVMIVHEQDPEKFVNMVNIYTYDSSVRKAFFDVIASECQLDEKAMYRIQAAMEYMDKVGQL